MKVECDRKMLMRALATGSPAVPSRTPKEILYGVKIVANGELTLETTDSEVGIRSSVDGAIIGRRGAVVVHHGRLKAIISELADDSVSLIEEGTRLQVSSGRSKFDVPVMNPDEMPGITLDEGSLTITANAQSLAQKLRRASDCADGDGRNAAESVFIDINGGKILVVSSVRFTCMLIEQIEAQVKGSIEGQVLIPKRGCQALISVLDQEAGDVSLIVSKSRISASLSSSATSLMSALKYPDWRILKPPTDHSASVPAAELERAVRQCSLLRDDLYRFFDFRFSENQLTISKESADVGNLSIDIPISYSGDEVKFAMDTSLIGRHFSRHTDKAAAVEVLFGDDSDGPMTFLQGDLRFICSPGAERRQ